MELSADENGGDSRDETSPKVATLSILSEEQTGRPQNGESDTTNGAVALPMSSSPNDGATSMEEKANMASESPPPDTRGPDTGDAVDPEVGEQARIEQVGETSHKQSQELPNEGSNGKIEEVSDKELEASNTPKISESDDKELEASNTPKISESDDKEQEASNKPKISNGVERNESPSQEIADKDGGSVDSSQKESARRSIDWTDTAAEDDLPGNATDGNSSRGDQPHAGSSLNGSRARTNNLDESTLTTIRDYLISKDYAAQPLEEEKVMEFTITTHRNATDRTRYRRNLAEDFEVSRGRDNVYDLIYQEEEYFSMASNFFKDLVNGASVKEGGLGLDSRTLTWLKRACGLQKPHDPLDQNLDDFSDDSEEVEPVATGRRLTRGVKKERRKEKMRKETEGISIFMEAIQEIERERKQPFKSNIQSYSYSEGDEPLYEEEDEEDSVEDANQFDSSTSGDSIAYDSTAQIRDYPPESELIASTEEGYDMSVRLMFRGKVVSNATTEELEEWQVPRKRRRDRERYDVAQKRAKETEQIQVGNEERPTQPDLESEAIGQTPPSESRLEYFFPNIDESIAHLSRVSKPKPMELLKPWVHARVCAKFYRFLGGRARRWARHEFFYPDLDAAWHGFDARAASIASKIPPGVKLTWREWKALRRQLGRPRRFSSAFIGQELNKRNRFRRLVRKMQQSPDSSGLLAFPVPAIITPGTSVTAYNKRYQVVHQGTVLFYSQGDDGYFVQFQAEELGCEFCPDTEVACLLPEVPPIVSRLSHGIGPSRVSAKAESMRDAETLSKNDRAYERFSLTSLIINLEKAKERKKAILDAMEEHNHFVSPLRSKYRNFPKVSGGRLEALQQTIGAWLHANLIHTNRSLRQGLELLQAYSEDSSSDDGTTLLTAGQSGAAADNGVAFDKHLLTALAKQLVLSMGAAKNGGKKLEDCTKRLLEMEARKVLHVSDR